MFLGEMPAAAVLQGRQISEGKLHPTVCAKKSTLVRKDGGNFYITVGFEA